MKKASPCSNNVSLQHRLYRLFLLLCAFVLFIPTIDAARSRRKKRVKQKKYAYSPLFPNFSKTYSKIFDPSETPTEQLLSREWEQVSDIPFDELILSWNALRPTRGKITFYVSVKHDTWSPWHRIAVWGTNYQQTFVNKLNPYVHTKHVRVELLKKRFGKGFKIKAVFSDGASPKLLNALFACVSNSKLFHAGTSSFDRPSVAVRGVPQQSQMINHPRAQDLCSPTSTSMLVNYFHRKIYNAAPNNMRDYISSFAAKVHDNGPLNIYGNWLLNVAQAHDSSEGRVFFRVERLNSFNELYMYLQKEIPVAVSVRKLRGGATPYANGHFMVILGWNNAKKTVICIDPAFKKNKATLKAYKLHDFLTAWGLSRNLSYIPIPRENWAFGSSNITTMS